MTKPLPAGKGPRTVEVAIQGVPRPRWLRRLAGFCARALEAAGAASWDISILLCNDERMTGLNSRYRKKDRTTDVLSFPREAETPRTAGRTLTGGLVAGDIAISLPTMSRNAAAMGSTDDEELKRLLVHGILHLAGMDHGRGKGRAMLSLQEKLLSAVQKETITTEPKR